MTNLDETSKSDVTLTPGTGGILNYQNYVEKVFRIDSRGDDSLSHSSFVRHGEIPTLNSSVDNSTPTLSNQTSFGVATEPTPDGIGPTQTSNERERRPHKVEATENPHAYPGPLALSLLTVGICISVFLVSLDRTIVATAIPRITNEFHSSNDVGWYGSAYLVTASALQPIYGRIFTMFNIKWSFLCALGIFELGSLICGVAPNSVALIMGRAIAGWGSAGILTGSFVVVAHAVPLQRRPVFSAAVGLMFALGAVIGPLLGGAFTDLVTWRWW